MIDLKSLVTLFVLLFTVAAVANPEPQGWGNQPPWRTEPPRPAPTTAYNNYPQPKQTGWGYPQQPQPSPRPTARPQPTIDPDDDEPIKWTAPPQWGPKGPRPFGPRVSTPAVAPPVTPTRRSTKDKGNPATVSYNSDQIPTTVAEAPREPVPFGVKCAGKKYDEYDVSNALTAGCFYWKKGTKIANTDFPRLFPNNQKFDFGDIKGQLYEFPLIESAPFINGEPGKDRVVFSTPECYLAGELTMQGQRVGQYTECSEEY